MRPHASFAMTILMGWLIGLLAFIALAFVSTYIGDAAVLFFCIPILAVVVILADLAAQLVDWLAKRPLPPPSGAEQ